MADSLSLVLVFLIGSGPAVVSCNLSDKEAESLVLTAQVTKYRPVLAPVAGIVGGGRTQLCALVEVKISDEGNVRSPAVV